MATARSCARNFHVPAAANLVELLICITLIEVVILYMYTAVEIRKSAIKID